jgi:predicted small secreted protein
MKDLLLTSCAIILILLLNSCGTMKGFGQDVQKAGDAISNAASRAAQ